MSRKSGSITRRGFIRTTGQAIGLGVGSVLIGCGSADSPSQEAGLEGSDTETKGYGPFKMGFQSYSLRQFLDLDSFIAQATPLGLKYVELYRGHLAPDSNPQKIEETRRRLADAGLVVNAFGVEGFSADHDRNRSLFEFGKALGVTNLSADPTKDAFDSLDRLVAEYNVRIAIHNHGPEDQRWRTPELIMDGVQDHDERIGACADLGHFLRADVDPVEAIEMLGSRVHGVHLKDFNAEGEDVVLGDGRLDLEGSLAALRKIGFSGPLSLEFEGDKEDPVPKMQICLERVRDALGRA